MKTIALVGGIGSGKSTIAHMFAELGAGVINLDDVGHFVLTTPGVKYDIARTFGANVFDERGEVVRSRLAAAAFDTPEHTEWLNAITHPVIMQECRRRIGELGQLHDMVVVEVTTGVESKRDVRWADALVAVVAPACVPHGARLRAWQSIDRRREPSYRFAENRRAACGDRRFHHQQRQRP